MENPRPLHPYQKPFAMKISLFLLGLLFAGGCSQHKPEAADTTAGTSAVAPGTVAPQQSAPAATNALSEQASQPEPDTPPAPLAPPLTDRKIIRNATLDFKVADFRASAKRITGLVNAFGGLISGEQESRVDDVLRSQMTIRIPAARLDPFLDTLQRESIFTTTKTISAEDVTKRFVDTEARVRSQKATEARYIQLLKQARNVKEVLEVEAQLRAIREDVEIQEAELREMKNDVAMSTVNLTFYQETEEITNPQAPYLSRFWTNLRGGFGLIGGFFLGLAYLLPLFAVLGGLGWIGSWWLRLRRQRAKP